MVSAYLYHYSGEFNLGAADYLYTLGIDVRTDQEACSK
jgi:hypothetical protein